MCPKVDGFIHLLPEGGGKPPFPYNRCAGLLEPSKQEVHRLKRKEGKGGRVLK